MDRLWLIVYCLRLASRCAWGNWRTRHLRIHRAHDTGRIIREESPLPPVPAIYFLHAAWKAATWQIP